MIYYHTDVFSSEKFSGNGLTVVFHEEEMQMLYMQKIAKEFKQFETIFLRKIDKKNFRAHIFTVEEELDFAGHPILGAVSTIHQNLYHEQSHIKINLELNKKTIQVESTKKDNYYEASMNQGIPQFIGTIEDIELKSGFMKALNLKPDYLHPELSMNVVSTGLPYLIIPLSKGIEEAKICVENLEEELGKVGAKFLYLFDVAKMEGRTWDNLGAVEDVATGSAAGPTGAYLYKWNIRKASEDIIINQGRFVGRPSRIRVSKDETTGEITVAGDVKIIVKGEFLV